MNPRIIAVKPIDQYKLILSFSNGENGIYDCSHLLNWGIFQELQNQHYFKQVQVLDGTVIWPHEQDICPDTLYLDSIKILTQNKNLEDLTDWNKINNISDEQIEKNALTDIDNQPLSLDLKGLKLVQRHQLNS